MYLRRRHTRTHLPGTKIILLYMTTQQIRLSIDYSIHPIRFSTTDDYVHSSVFTCRPYLIAPNALVATEVRTYPPFYHLCASV